MSGSNSWSNDLVIDESNSWSNVESIDNVEFIDETGSDINLGIWILIPLSVIIVIIVGVHNYDPCKKVEHNTHP